MRVVKIAGARIITIIMIMTGLSSILTDISMHMQIQIQIAINAPPHIDH